MVFGEVWRYLLQVFGRGDGRDHGNSSYGGGNCNGRGRRQFRIWWQMWRQEVSDRVGHVS